METNGTSALAMAPNPREMAMLATVMRQALMEMRTSLLKPGVDYGIIPGTKKDTLLKPGAEKLASGFKLYPIPKLLTTVEDWNAGFFYYRYQIDLMHRETGQVWGTGIGSCNSREKKYGYRWVTEAEVPADLDKDKLVREDGMQTLTEFDFAIKKAETGGKYGKPAEHWEMLKEAIATGKAKKIQKETKSGKSDAWEITVGVVKFRISNPEIYDQVNTIDKMAFKRAYVAAVLNATNASEFFTQDMEDFMSIALPDEDDVVEGVVTEITPTPAAEATAALSKMAEKHALFDAAEKLAQSLPVEPPTPGEFIPEGLPDWLPENNRLYLVNRSINEKLMPAGATWDDFLALCNLKPADCEQHKTVMGLFAHVKECAAKTKAQTISTAEAAKTLGKGDKTPIGREPVTTKDPVEDAALNQQAEQIADGLATVKPGKSPFDSDSVGDAIKAEKVNGKAYVQPPF